VLVLEVALDEDAMYTGGGEDWSDSACHAYDDDASLSARLTRVPRVREPS